MALSILDGNQTATTLSTILTSGAHIPAHTVVSLGSQAITDMRSAVSGSVVSISNFPSTQTIAGTVTANGVWEEDNLRPSVRGENDAPPTLGIGIAINKNGSETGIVGINNPLPISGTVTANAGGSLGGAIEIVNDVANVSHKIATQLYDDNGSAVGIPNNPLRISGTVTANLSSVPTHGVTIANSSVTVNGTFYQATQPVSLTSTTVTVSALPSGALTTRFGSVTTANTAQLTAAVTNSARKYLLCQNLDSSTTVTIGIGFTPTTTQGIQLAAGGGIIMDSFVSTGAVWWLSSTTGSNFTILEG